MLSANQLADFWRASNHHQQTLSNLLVKYTALMQGYKRLKSDYEEERNLRERYKQTTKGTSLYAREIRLGRQRLPYAA